MTRPITLRQIEAFRAVVETGSVTGAAGVMHVSQPSVSRLLRDFETGVGFALFERAKGRLAATPEARLLYEEIQKYFHNLHRLTHTAAEIRALARGQLRIGSFIALSIAVMPAVIRRLTLLHPDLHVSCTTAQSRQIVDLVDSRFADLGIVDPHAVTAALEVERQWQFRCVLAVPAGHPLAQEERVSTDRLAQEKIVGLEREFLARYPAGRSLHDRLAAQIHVQVHQSVVACALVAEGAGVAIVDPFTARFCAPTGVRIVPLDVSIPFEMCVVSSRDDPASMAAREFLDLFCAEIDRACDEVPYIERCP